VFSAFFKDRYSYLFLSLLERALLPSSQHGPMGHLAFSFSFSCAMLHFYLGPFPCACLRTKQGKRNKTAKLFPCCTSFLPSEDSLQHAFGFFFYLSIYFLPFCASSVVDIWSLTLVQYPPPLFARKDERKTGQDTLILNPLQNQNLYRIPSILSCFHFSSKWIARACSSNC
jgi:hypothetical protein